MLGSWIGAVVVSAVVAAPAVLAVVYVVGAIWRQFYADGSEEEVRRARRVVGVGALLLALLLLFIALPFLRTLISAGDPDPSWHRVRKPALAWLMLLLGLALPYAALAVRLVDGRLSPRLRGMALVLGGLPVWLAGLALGFPACWGTPLVLCGGLMGPALGIVLMGPLAWLAVATLALARVPPEHARRRASGVWATAAWTTGIVASALFLGAW